MNDATTPENPDYERWLRLHPIWPLQLGCEIIAGNEPGAASRRLVAAYSEGQLVAEDIAWRGSDEAAQRIYSLAEKDIAKGRLVARTEEFEGGVVHWVFQYHLLSWASIGAEGVTLSDEMVEARATFGIPDPQSAQLLAAMASTTDKKERQVRMNKIFHTRPTAPGPSAIVKKES